MRYKHECVPGIHINIIVGGGAVELELELELELLIECHQYGKKSSTMIWLVFASSIARTLRLAGHET